MRNYKKYMVVILGALAIGVLCLTIVIGENPKTKHPDRKGVVKVHVTGVTGAVEVDRDGNLSPEEQAAQSQLSSGPEIHEDARDETPPGVAVQEVQEGLNQDTAPGKTGPKQVGGAQGYSCRRDFSANHSSRNGQKVLLYVLHYTVSPNRGGWGDVYSIRDLFKILGFGASSTYIMDFEGNCLQIVRESDKAWTQGNFNGRSISIEIIATGRETRTQWEQAPLMRNGYLSAFSYDVMRRNGLPIRFVDPVGCEVQRAGYTDHNHLECGNNHTDVAPSFPFSKFKSQLRQRITEAGNRVSKLDRARCRKINWWRKHRPGGQSRANAVFRKRALLKRGFNCTSLGLARVQ